MSYPDLGENTLGVILGKRRGQNGPASPARAMRQARAQGASLGTGYLGVGAGVIAIIQAGYGIILLAWNWNQYPDPLLVALAWLLLVVCLGGVAATILARGESMPDWLFGFVLLGVAGVVALDFVAIWPLGQIAELATASACASTGLLVSVTLRRGWEIITASVGIGIAFVVAIMLTSPVTTSSIPLQLGVVGLATLPPIFGVYVVKRFRRLVQTELDRVLVQSTVSAPRFAVGMLASEELARLDLAAEELLDAVATGRTTLPLDNKTSSRAASLATELRLHLIEGRRETWLYHAVTESETLGKHVELGDRGSLAGLLDQHQRDGLLAAVWLLVADQDKKPASARIEIGPSTPSPEPRNDSKISIPIVVTSKGIPRNRVEPSVWEALGKVGRFVDSTHDSSLRVEIECLVDNPADR